MAPETAWKFLSCVFAVFLSLFSITLSACSPPAPAPAAQPTGISRECFVVRPGADAPRARVRVELDRTSLRIADRLAVRLIASAPPEFQVTWPTVPEELDGFTVVSITDPTPTEAPVGTTAWVRTLELDPAIADTHAVPSLAFTFRSTKSGTRPIVVTTEPISVEVRSVLPDNASAATDAESDPAQLRGIADVPPDRNLRTPVIIASGAAAVIALGAIGYLVSRRGRTPREEPPEVVARRRLSAMGKNSTTDAASISIAMTELADITRRYAASHYQLPSADRTTEQLLSDLSEQRDAPVDELRRLLQQFDQVKFAGAHAHVDDVQAAIKDVRAFVDATISTGGRGAS